MLGFNKKKNDPPEISEKMQLEKKIINTLKEIFDPEIPVNVFDLGLIYEINVQDDMKVHIVMTLTAPNCPVAEALPNEVKEKVAATKGVKECEVEMTFEPTWTKEMMSEEAMLDLGFL
ncbi:MAG: SUF system Fe-S cluster assembly protein [Bacteroidetes bacterium 4572_77]|nr:MAG: SUF system Fe-S cluster assembly protein [Bacteroidetes bacterium 4572_77]